MSNMNSAGCEELVVSPEDLSIINPSWRKRSYQCGHRGARRFQLSLFGEESKVIEQDERCPECYLELFQEHAIRCCFCDLSILPGEGVALHAIEDDEAKEGSVKTENGYIGCMKMSCCDPGTFSGHWTMDGFKSAFA